LKQKVYGKLSIPKECYTVTTDFHGNKLYEPWTPYVWYSFLTGQKPKITKQNLHQWNNSILEFFRKKKLFTGLGWIMRKIGFKREMIKLQLHETFIQYAVNPLIIRFPLLTDWTLKLNSNKIFSESIISSYF
jgi:hypothetical protein